MVNGIINLIPAAKIGHIGLYRDENFRTRRHFLQNAKDIEDRLLIVVDQCLLQVVLQVKPKKRGAKSMIFYVLACSSRRYKSV